MAGTDYTTVARVKRAMFPGEEASPPTTHDGLIGDIITEVTDRIRKKLGNREIDHQSNIEEYADGTGTERLWLREGPLTAVNSVKLIEYSDDGLGAQVETETTVVAADYVLGNIRDEGALGRGFIDLLGSAATWTKGRRNYKVDYNAGFATVPVILTDVATRAVLVEINQRPGLDLVWHGSFRMEATDPKKLDEAINRTVATLMDYNPV